MNINSVRLLIRNLQASDLDDFIFYRSNPEVTKYQGFDVMTLEQASEFIVENASKYSPRECPIEISLKRYKSGIELQVKDQGPGIPDPEKKKIFSKFYRIGNEATRRTQGTGLGLYLCSKIAKDHNGDISVTNNEPHGSNFTVIFKT